MQYANSATFAIEFDEEGEPVLKISVDDEPIVDFGVTKTGMIAIFDVLKNAVEKGKSDDVTVNFGNMRKVN